MKNSAASARPLSRRRFLRRSLDCVVLPLGATLPAQSRGADALRPSENPAKARPLAQDFSVVVRSRNPRKFHFKEPALIALPGGTLLCGYEAYGEETGYRIAASTDGGRTWMSRADLPHLMIGMFFLHRESLYLLANAKSRKDVVLLHSEDEGRSWAKSSVLFQGAFYNGPTGYVMTERTIYRGFGIPRQGGSGYWRGSVVVAGDLTGDLMKPTSWRITPPVYYPGTPLPLMRKPGWDTEDDNWVEPNVVLVDGQLLVMHRCRMNRPLGSSVSGVCTLTDSGGELKYDFGYFHPMPGSRVKFFIFHDPVSRLFWNVTNIGSADLFRGEFRAGPETQFEDDSGHRRILMLMYSTDAHSWFQAGCIVMTRSPAEGFCMAAPAIVGDDLLVVSRTLLGVENPDLFQSNMITFHRVRDFRSLALDLHPATKGGKA